MQYSKYLNLKLPQDTDPVKVSDLTENFEALDELLGSSTVRMVTGTYTGTGTSGSSNKNTLTLPFSPKLFVVTGSGSYRIVAVAGNSSSFVGSGLSLTHVNPPSNNAVIGGSLNTYLVTISLGTTTTWYGSSASVQMNNSGATYYYAAIG